MTWRDRTTPIQIGDTVRFSRRALKGIFKAERILQSPEGVVTGIEERDGMRFAMVEWGEPGIPELVNTLNLRRVGTPQRGR